MSRIVESIPSIAEMPLEFQLATLLSANALRSVEWTRGSIAIVIDVLDESGSEADRKILLQALSKGLSDLPSFIRIMVVSRQEPDIQHALGSHSHVRSYPLYIDSATNTDDVSKFLRHNLEEIRTKNGFLGTQWPGDDAINALANSAGGLFIWHRPRVCTWRAMISIGDFMSSLTSNQKVILPDRFPNWTACTRRVYNLLVWGMTLHSALTAAAYCYPMRTNSSVVFCHRCSPRITST